MIRAAIGTNKEDYDRAKSLQDNGVDLIVIDTAHGHSAKVLNVLSKLKKIKRSLKRSYYETRLWPYQLWMLFRGKAKLKNIFPK